MNLPNSRHTGEEPFPFRAFLLFSLISALVCFALYSNSYNESLFKNLIQAGKLTEGNISFFNSRLMNNQLTAPGWTKLLSFVWMISPGSIPVSRCLSFAGHILALYYLMRFFTLLTKDRFWAYFAGLLWSVDPVLLSDVMLLSGGSWFSALMLAGLFHFLHYTNGNDRSIYLSAFLLGGAYLFLLSSWIVLSYIFIFIMVDIRKSGMYKILVSALLFLLPFLCWHFFKIPGSPSLLMFSKNVDIHRYISGNFDVIIRALIYLPIIIGLVPLIFSSGKTRAIAVKPAFWGGLIIISAASVSLLTGGGLLLFTTVLPTGLMALFCESMIRLQSGDERRYLPQSAGDLYPIPFFIPLLVILLANALAVGWILDAPYKRNHIDYIAGAEFKGGYALTGEILRAFAGDDLIAAGPQPYTLAFFSGVELLDIFKIRDAAGTEDNQQRLIDIKPEIIVYPLLQKNNLLAVEKVFPELLTPSGNTILEPIGRVSLPDQNNEETVTYIIYYCHWGLQKIDFLLELYEDEMSGFSIEDKQPDSPVEGEN